MIDALPPKQKQVLMLIASLTDERGFPPTLAELACALGLRNRMTVHQHVVALRKKGMVDWEPGLNRSLRVLVPQAVPAKTALHNGDSGEKYPKGVPLAGTIAAGSPIDAMETDEYLEIDGAYRSSGCFALKVKGDSMIEDGIYDGDFVIIKPNPSPNNGDTVVALLADGTATLKRFYREKGGFRLQPANSQLEPIFISRSETLDIQGVVCGLYRKL